MIRWVGFPDTLDEFVFIHIGGGAVCDHKTDLPLLKVMEGIIAVIGCRSLMTVLLQNLLDERAFVQIVVQHKDLHGPARLLA